MKIFFRFFLVLLFVVLPSLCFGWGEVTRPQLESNSVGYGSDMVGFSGGSSNVTEKINELDKKFSSDISVNVGAGEIFTSLSTALDYYSDYKPENKSQIKIILKSGFILDEQIYIKGQNLNHIRIESEDNVVSVARTGIVNNILGIVPTIIFEDSISPEIAVAFEMDSSGADLSQYGIVSRNSNVKFDIHPNYPTTKTGFKNSSERNFEAAWGSVVHGRYTDFSDTQNTTHEGIGVRISNGSIGYFKNAVANNLDSGFAVSNAVCDLTETTANNNYYSGVSANSGAIIFLNGADLSGNVTGGSTNHGNLNIDTGAIVNGYEINTDNSGNSGIYLDAGVLNSNNISSKNSSNYGLQLLNGSYANVGYGSDLSGNLVGIYVDSSELKGVNADITGSISGQSIIASSGNINLTNSQFYSSIGSATSMIQATHGSNLNLYGGNGSNNKSALFRILTGSIIRADNFTATGCLMGGYTTMIRIDESEFIAPYSDFSGRVSGSGITSNYGSRVVITNSNIMDNTATEKTSDINALGGSIIHATGANGGTGNVPNTINSAGIVFK